MRHATSGRRSRNRGNGNRRGAPNRSQVFDSNGPDVRIRGTAHQVCEKYAALAKDAAASGDRILAESYLQHAEHYQRVINGWNEKAEAKRAQDAAERTEETDKDQQDELGLPSSIVGKKQKSDQKQEELEDA